MHNDPNSQSNKLFNDSPHGATEFNSMNLSDVQKDLEKINKMFSVANALCDILINSQQKEINKWAGAKIGEHVKKINSSFLL